MDFVTAVVLRNIELKSAAQLWFHFKTVGNLGSLPRRVFSWGSRKVCWDKQSKRCY